MTRLKTGDRLVLTVHPANKDNIIVEHLVDDVPALLTGPVTLSVQAGMAMVDAICDKDESLSPRHTHSDVIGIVSTGVLGDY